MVKYHLKKIEYFFIKKNLIMNLMAMKEVMGASVKKKSQTSRSKQNVKKMWKKFVKRKVDYQVRIFFLMQQRTK
jgi:hypothetical protein